MNHQPPTIKSSLKAYLYLLPLLSLLGLFTVYPMVKALMMSFYTDYDFFSDRVSRWGWGNYQLIFHDPDFYLAFKNTLVIVGIGVPLAVGLALGLALLLNQRLPGRRWLQTIYFVPFVTSTVAISLVWNWFFRTDDGLMNQFLIWLGQTPIDWLTNPHYTMVVLLSLTIWKSLGFNILLLLVGLNQIDQRLYQAARLDGASRGQCFSAITWPLLRPMLYLVSFMGILKSFKTFDEIYALYQGQVGPAKSALTLVFYIYQKFYNEYQYGIATAAGVVLLVTLVVIISGQQWGQRRWFR